MVAMAMLVTMVTIVIIIVNLLVRVIAIVLVIICQGHWRPSPEGAAKGNHDSAGAWGTRRHPKAQADLPLEAL